MALRKQKAMYFAVLTMLLFVMVSLNTAWASQTENKIVVADKRDGPQALGFRKVSLGGLGGGPTDIRGGDVDNDGDIDLCSLGDHSNPGGGQDGIIMWTNDGTGSSFSAKQTGGNFGYGGVALADVNNDGKQDIGFGIHHNYPTSGLGSKLLNVGLGDGSGKWTDWSTGLAQESQDWGMFGTDFADFNNDGWLDIGSAAFGAGDGVHTYINNKDGTWKHTGIMRGGNCDNEFKFCDINADGNTDFVSSWEGGVVFIGDGKGGWTEKDSGISPWGMFHRGPSAGDINNDGYQDLAICNMDTARPEVYAWDNTAGSWKNSSTGISPTMKGYTRSAFADMDNDGNMDLVAAGDAGIEVWKGDGTGKWTLGCTIKDVSGIPNSLTIPGDLDHNSYLDIACIFGNPNYVNVFLNDVSASTLSITLTSPRGGEKFYPGSIRFIEWASSVPGGGKGSVKLELSTAGNGGPWTLIEDGLPNNGKHQWTIPNSPSKNCYIKATVTAGGSASGTNAKPFEIIGSSGPSPVAITLITPNGNENWTVGSGHDITWSANGGIGTLSIKLEYSVTGSGGSWLPVANSETNDGTYTWTIPDTPSTDCYVKATVTDTSSPPQSANDINNGNFTIYKSGSPPPPPGQLAYVTINPQSASLIVSDTRLFTADAYYSNGTAITNATFAWSSGGGVGTVNPATAKTTTFTATAAGFSSVNVTATMGGESAKNSSWVSVHNPPPPVTLKSVEITPATISGKAGQQFNLNAKAYDKDHIEIASNVTFAWELIGNVGTLAPLSGASTVFTATESGVDQIKATATLGGTSVSNITQVTIAQLGVTLDSVVVSPTQISGKVGDSFTLKATAYDSKGNDITTTTVFTWSINKKIAQLSSTTGDKITVTLKSAGDATIYVEGSYGGDYKQASTSVKSKDSFEIPLWLIIAIIALITVLIALMLLAGRKKRKKKEEQNFR